MALTSRDRNDQEQLDHEWKETETPRVPKNWISNWFEEPLPPDKPPGRRNPPWLAGVFSNALFTFRN
jgi:hypothetical protein